MMPSHYVDETPGLGPHMKSAIKLIASVYDHDLVSSSGEGDFQGRAINSMPLRNTAEIHAWAVSWLRLMIALKVGNNNVPRRTPASHP